MKRTLFQRGKDEKETNEMYDEFKAEIAENVAKTIRSLRRDGTVAMGLDNLRQVTPTPKTADGPRGGNVAYLYRIMFNEVAAEVARGFVYHEDFAAAGFKQWRGKAVRK